MKTKPILKQKSNWLGIAIFCVAVYLLLTNKTDAGIALITMAAGLMAYPEGEKPNENK